MEINADKSVQFEVGDFVCVLVDKHERCGDIIDVDGTSVLIDAHDGEKIWVEEKSCYPG